MWITSLDWMTSLLSPLTRRERLTVIMYRLLAHHTSLLSDCVCWSLQSVCEAPLDTVGAVCVDQRGGVAGGVSSGGISLKFPGRIGQVGVCVT